MEASRITPYPLPALRIKSLVISALYKEVTATWQK
jgi:hypothetical protein